MENNSNKILVKCENCGKEFYVRKYDYEDSKNKIFYCSKQCRWEDNHILIQCNICGKYLDKLITYVISKENITCSQECRDIYYKERFAKENNPNYGKKNKFKGENNPNYKGGKIKIKCDYCGEEFEEKPSKIKLSEHHFCCKECYYKWKSENTRGENNSNWRPELTQDERERNRIGKNEWRREVFERDNYTCQLSGQRGGQLNAHHLNAYNSDKDNRNNVDNGITLTEELHKLFHKLYGKGDNTIEQFEEFKIRYNNGEFKEVA